MRRDLPVISATASCPKRWISWSRADWTGGEGGEFLDERVAGGDGFLAEDGVSVAVDGGPAHEGSAFVGEGFVELDGEGVAQVVEDVFARREVDGDVVPFVGGDFGDAAVHEGLAGGDDLDDASASVGEVVVDGAEERGALHGGEEVAEEPLFGALEGGEGGGFGGAVEGPGPVPVAGASDDAGGLEGVVDVAVDDLEGSGVGVVDAALLGGEGGVRGYRPRRPGMRGRGPGRGRGP